MCRCHVSPWIWLLGSSLPWRFQRQSESLCAVFPCWDVRSVVCCLPPVACFLLFFAFFGGLKLIVGMLMKSRYYNAVVKKFVPNGVQLDLGVEKPGYLHVSRMKPKGEFVSDPSEVLTLKDVIPVRVWKIKGREVEARVQSGRGTSTCKQRYHQKGFNDLQ